MISTKLFSISFNKNASGCQLAPIFGYVFPVHIINLDLYHQKLNNRKRYLIPIKYL